MLGNTEQLQQAALNQAKKYESKVINRKDAESKNLKPTTLQSLTKAFENEKFVQVSNEEGEDLIFHIKMMDPGVLFLETTSPLYFGFLQSALNDPNYVETLTDDEKLRLVKEDYQHQQRICVMCVMDPPLSVDGSDGGYPIGDLPSDIVRELYKHIMGSVEESQDLLESFREKESE